MSKWCAYCQREREEGKFCMECGAALTAPGSNLIIENEYARENLESLMAFGVKKVNL